MSDVNYVRLDDGNGLRNSTGGRWVPKAADRSQKLKHNYYQFLQDLYWYYENGGFVNVTFSLLMRVMSAIFTLCFIFMMASMVRWEPAFKETLPQDVPLLNYPSKNVGVAWAISVGILALVSTSWAAYYIRQAWRLRHYCQKTILLDDDEISTMPWDVFIKLVADRDPDILPKTGATWEDLVVVMMRRTNYLVALYNQRLMNVSVPCFPSWKSVTTVFEWSFDVATRDLWTETGEVNPSYIEGNHEANVARLRTRFITTGVLGLVLSPLVLVSMLVYAFFVFLDQVRNSPGIIFSRTWSTLARWRFRNFNEVPCALNDRLASAYPSARNYVSQFKNPVTITLARFAVFCLAVLMAPIVIFTVLAEHVLSYNLWGGPAARSVLFVATLIATALAIVRALIPGDDFVFAPHKHMAKVMNHVKLPPTEGFDWVNEAHGPEVRTRFSGYFKSKFSIFFSELAAVITGPFVFMYSMSAAADELLTFLRENTINLGQGLGTAVRFTKLDVSDAKAPIDPDNTSSAPASSLGAFGLALSDTVLKPPGKFDKNELLRDKLQDSVMTFKGFYPHWKPTAPESAELLDKSEYIQYGSTMYRPDPATFTSSSGSTGVVDSALQYQAYAGRRATRMARGTLSAGTSNAFSRSSGTYAPPHDPNSTRNSQVPLDDDVATSSNDPNEIQMDTFAAQSAAWRPKSTTKKGPENV